MRKKRKLLIRKKGAFAKDHRWCWIVRRLISALVNPPIEAVSFYRTGYGARMAQERYGGKRQRDSVDNLGGWWDFRSLNPRKPSQRRQRRRAEAASNLLTEIRASDAAS